MNVIDRLVMTQVLRVLSVISRDFCRLYEDTALHRCAGQPPMVNPHLDHPLFNTQVDSRCRAHDLGLMIQDIIQDTSRKNFLTAVIVSSCFDQAIWFGL